MQISVALLAAIMLGALGADAQNTIEERTPSGDPAPLPAVKLMTVGETRQVGARTFFGRVAARETVDLSFEVGGRLTEFPVREGATIDEGDLVAALDQAPLTRAEERARLSLENAERDLDRAERLAASATASEVRAEDARTARDLAEVALRDAEADLDHATLHAPFDGLIAARLARTFSNVAPGQPIVRVHDMSQVRVEIDVPERVFLLAGGRPDDVAFMGELPSGETVPLTLAEYEAQTGAIGQSFNVALAIPDEAARGLIPGVSMTVTASLRDGTDAIALPSSALLATSDRDFAVMLFEPDPDRADEGTVRQTRIDVAAPTGTTIEVAGLPEDAEVVVAGAHLLEDGQQVRRYDGLIVEE